MNELELKKELLKNRNRFLSLLNNKERADSFMASALTIASSTDLSRCSAESIVSAMLKVAMYDLNPDSSMGEAYFVPRGGSVVFQIGYKGFIKLLDRAGWDVDAFPVYSCDEFKTKFSNYRLDFEFEPNYEERQNYNPDWCFKNLSGVIVVCTNRSTGRKIIDYTTKGYVEKIRMESDSQKSKEKPAFIWEKWYEEQAIKTAIRRTVRLVPLSGDTQSAIAYDNKADTGTPDIVEGVIVEETETKKENDVLNNMISETNNEDN